MSNEGPLAEERPPLSGDVTENDKLMAALSYPIPLVAIYILVSEANKVRRFQKFHAVQALVYWVPAGIIGCVVGAFTCGIPFFLLWLISLWPAYESYRGKYLELPVITDFIRRQGWV